MALINYCFEIFAIFNYVETSVDQQFQLYKLQSYVHGTKMYDTHKTKDNPIKQSCLKIGTERESRVLDFTLKFTFHTKHDTNYILTKLKKNNV